MAPIAVLSHGGDALNRLLSALHRRSIVPVVLLLTDPPARTPSLPLSDTLIKLRTNPARMLRMAAWAAVRRSGCGARWNPGIVRGRVAAMIPVGPINGAGMLQLLEREAPGLLLLANCGIISDATIRAAGCPVLSGHPALLPWVRGRGIVGGALAYGVPVGATVHRVNAGVDTGPILDRELVPIAGGESPAELRNRAHALTAELLADAVQRICDGRAPRAVPQHARYPRSPLNDAAATERAEALVAAGEAARLFAIWRDWFGGHSIPADAATHPPVGVEPLAPQPAPSLPVASLSGMHHA
jgi:hypothetical protein